MCLILFAYQTHPDWDLIVLANRDEFHARPTADADVWRDPSNILAGRDLQAGGTWLGIDPTNSSGRFAALTNYREGEPSAGEHTRGRLVSEFLAGDLSVDEYAAAIDGADFAGFNLLLHDTGGMVCVSNRHPTVTVAPGVYGLSNGVFDSPWPKLVAGRETLRNLLSDDFSLDDLFAVLADRTRAADHALPDSGVSFELESLLSSRFIVSPEYGTRCSTLFLQGRERSLFIERRFNRDGEVMGESRFEAEPATPFARLSE